MNLQTNALTNLAPHIHEKETEGESQEENAIGKSADFSNAFAVCSSKPVPKRAKHTQEYSKAARDGEEKKEEAKLSLQFMSELERN